MFFMRPFMYYELLLKFWRYESWLNFKRLHFILIISVFLSMMNACISEKSPITTVWQSSPNNYDTIFPDSQCFPYTLPLSSSYMLPSFINILKTQRLLWIFSTDIVHPQTWFTTGSRWNFDAHTIYINSPNIQHGHNVKTSLH